MREKLALKLLTYRKEMAYKLENRGVIKEKIPIPLFPYPHAVTTLPDAAAV